MMQASPEYRLDEHSLNNMFVRNGAEMAPISQFVTLKKVQGAEVANRFNLYSCITENVNPADGYSSGKYKMQLKKLPNRFFRPDTVTNTAVWHAKKPETAD